MKKKQINIDDLSKQLAEELRSGKPLTGIGGILSPLIKQVIEAALDGEMDQHIKESKVQGSNRRNGHSRKQLKSSVGSMEILSPRDRSGSFDPQTLAKRQRVLPGDLDEKILGLYGLGMSYKDMRTHISEMYGVELSEGTINSITDRVIPAVREWQSRPLESVYPIIWLDAMHFKIRDDGKVRTKAIYTVLGITTEGKKEILGLYQGDNESASYWLQVLTDLKHRGVEDILIASIDNLRGFAQAIENIFPKTEVQLCIVHQIRNSLRYIPWNKQREFIKDLKKVYRAGTKEQAEYELDQLEQKWGSEYSPVIKSWRVNWDRLTQYFKYPEPIRRLIYTTNTVEGYHRMVRKVTKTKGAFTSEMAVMKLVYLATINFEKKWQNAIHSWAQIYNQLYIYFDERLLNPDTLK